MHQDRAIVVWCDPLFVAFLICWKQRSCIVAIHRINVSELDMDAKEGYNTDYTTRALFKILISDGITGRFIPKRTNSSASLLVHNKDLFLSPYRKFLHFRIFGRRISCPHWKGCRQEARPLCRDHHNKGRNRRTTTSIADGRASNRSILFCFCLSTSYRVPMIFF